MWRGACLASSFSGQRTNEYRAPRLCSPAALRQSQCPNRTKPSSPPKTVDPKTWSHKSAGTDSGVVPYARCQRWPRFEVRSGRASSAVRLLRNQGLQVEVAACGFRLGDALGLPGRSRHSPEESPKWDLSGHAHLQFAASKGQCFTLQELRPKQCPLAGCISQKGT